VVLADKLSLAQLRSVMRAGASAYLLHDVSVEALHVAMNIVIAGEKVLTSALVEILLADNGLIKRPAAKYNGVNLNDAEKRILKCLAVGNSNKQIAINCDITEGTVKAHLRAIYRRINVANRTQAALWALDHIPLQPEGSAPTPQTCAES
jgi:two-component system nitrate/nitrite response regulator NarL